MLRQFLDVIPVKTKPLVAILFGAALIRVLCAVTNVGFMAIDDYVYMLKLAFPAQNMKPVSEVLASTWVHPPLPMLLLTRLSQWPLTLGLKDPLHQIRFVYALMGLFNVLSVWAAFKCFEVFSRRREGLIAAGLVAFHCVMPFFSTRVLFETFSMSLITISLYFFLRFSKHQTRRDLFFSVLFVALASLVRFQSGVCYLAIMLMLLLVKNYRRHFPVFIVFSSIFFLATGLIDLILGREFHQSVFDYIKYNIEHSSDYGRSGPFNYLLLFFGLSLPPLFFKKWSLSFLKKRYAELWPAICFFGLFLLLHSAVPHKEDRFMIPIIPVFLLLLAPLLNELVVEQRIRRLKIFAVVNLIILVLASFFTAQWNVIGVARFLHENRQFRSLINYHGSLVFMPSAYMDRPDLQVKGIAHNEATKKALSGGCDQLIAVRNDILDDFLAKKWPFSPVTASEPGPIEKLIVKMNPKRNGRRAKISLFLEDRCHDKH